MLALTNSPAAPTTPTPLGVVGVFALRTDDCPECEGRGCFDGGDYHPDDPRWGVRWECDNCDGTGEVPETCNACLSAEPLNDDGECRRCAMETELMADPVHGDPFGMVR